MKPQAPAGIPASPPAEVLQQVDTAARVLHELKAQRINLEFEVDDDTRRVHVKVVDGNGEVLRRVPATDLQGMLSGDGAGVLFDARG